MSHRTHHFYENWKSSTNTSHTHVIFGQLTLSSTYPTSCKISKNVCHKMITIFVVISSVMSTPRVSMNFIIKLWNNAMNIRWKRNTFACTFRLNKLKALQSERVREFTEIILAIVQLLCLLNRNTLTDKG